MSLQLGGHVAGERLHALRIAALAQNVIVQREAATTLRLRRQQHAAVLSAKTQTQKHEFCVSASHEPTSKTYLTLVARHMEAAIQGHHTNRLLFARFGQNRLPAHAATRRKFPANTQSIRKPSRPKTNTHAPPTTHLWKSSMQ